MKKKIFGILLTLVLAVTGFGLVGCGGGNNPAPGPGPGPGPEPAPEVSYDDDLTPVAIEDTGLGFYLEQYDTLDNGDISYYNLQEDVGLAFVDGVTGNNITDLVIPAYVRDEDNNTYKVVGIENLLYTFDAEINDWTDEFNEAVANIKTITIPSTVDYLDEHIFSSWYSYEDPENSESWIEGYYYLESLEGIILNNRTGLINGLYYETRYLADAILDTEYPDGDAPDGAYETVVETFFNHETETDLYYLGNPDNLYMYLFFAGASYYSDEEPEGELVADVNEDCVVIGENAFMGSDVTKVNVPSTLKTIGYGAFGYCEYITNMIIASNMYGIDDIYNTYYCNGDNINKWEILDRETEIFLLCEILPDPHDDADNYTYYNFDNIDNHCYYLGNKDNPYLYLVYYINNGNTENTVVTVNENCKVIGPGAFAGYDFAGVVLPNGLTTIGGMSFRGTSLESITIPETVKYICNGAFTDCDNLNEIIVPASVEYLDCHCNAALYLQGLKMFEVNGYISVGSFYIPTDLDYSDYADVISQRCYSKAGGTFVYDDVDYYRFDAQE